jgi:predicted dehydrogenase
MILDLGEGKKQKEIFIEKPAIEPINAIQTELETFYKSIKNNTIPLVTIEDGYNSLELAYKIIEKINY